MGSIGMGRRLRALVCAGLLPATGCSYMFVYGPPPEAARSGGPERIECTTRSRAPAVDTVLGIALSGLALPLLAAQSNCDTADGFCLDWSGVFHSAGAVLLGSGALELASGAILLELRFPPAALLGIGAFLLLAALILLVLVPFVWGATPGMALADLRVSAADGGSPTLSAASLRFLGALLTGALAGVPLLVAAFDRKGRTLSDLISGTTLVPAR